MGFDGVLVLGKELRRDRGRALRELRARSAAAAIALRQGAAAVASLEAPLVGQEQAGSAIVAAFLRELGVPQQSIILAEQTRSTREEAIAGCAMARDRGWRRTLVITARYHVPRARMLMEEHFGRSAVSVHAPEALLRAATATERAWILAGSPSAAALAAEAPVERVLHGLARVLRPLPDALRWSLEVRAGAALRDAGSRP